jgi:hypothetical protein
MEVRAIRPRLTFGVLYRPAGEIVSKPTQIIPSRSEFRPRQPKESTCRRSRKQWVRPKADRLDRCLDGLTPPLSPASSRISRNLDLRSRHGGVT